MQLSSVLMAPARHMYVRLDREGENIFSVGNQQDQLGVRAFFLWFSPTYHFAAVSCISTG